VVRRALRASSRDDNKFFDHYLLYHRKHASLLPVSYRMDISERYAFQVTDRKGRGLPNCRVTISGDDRILWHGRTDARGHMLFFPRVTTASVGVKTFYASFLFGGKTLVRAFKRARYGSDRPWKVKMDVEKATNQPRVEVLFLLDTTGSMSDEIARIQQTLLAITAKVKRQTPGAELRFGMVLYRDRTDAYVTRRYPFTGDIKQFNRALQQVRAAGGGDTPEAMNMGLYAGIEQMKWSPSALRLVFLVADAPPHLDYGNDVPYTKTLRSAVAKGIKIYPVAASGLDKRGTYIYRQIAQFTQAKFLFIEYGSGTAARHGISGPTSSNNLDDIVLRIVKTELKHYMN
jgi:Mg-chelatase subunit ChlD